jgi:hypothetical protein
LLKATPQADMNRCALSVIGAGGGHSATTYRRIGALRASAEAR